MSVRPSMGVTPFLAGKRRTLNLVLRPFSLPLPSAEDQDAFSRAKAIKARTKRGGRFCLIDPVGGNFYLARGAGVCMAATLARHIPRKYTGSVIYLGEFRDGHHYYCHVMDGVIDLDSEVVVRGEEELAQLYQGRGAVMWFSAQADAITPAGDRPELLDLQKEGLRLRSLGVAFTLNKLPHFSQLYLMSVVLVLGLAYVLGMGAYEDYQAEVERLKQVEAQEQAKLAALVNLRPSVVPAAVNAWLSSDAQMYRAMGAAQRELTADDTLIMTITWPQKDWTEVVALRALAEDYGHRFLDRGDTEPYAIEDPLMDWSLDSLLHKPVVLEEWLPSAGYELAQVGVAMTPMEIQLGGQFRLAKLRLVTPASNRMGIRAVGRVFSGVPSGAVTITERYGALGVASELWEMEVTVFGDTA